MSYCTYSDVQLEAGTSLGTITTANITSLITRSDEEIADMLTVRGVSVPSSATQLKTASIYLTIAKIKRRQAHELTRPNSLDLGDLSFSVNTEAEAATYEAKAKVAVDRYVATAASRSYVRSVRGF